MGVIGQVFRVIPKVVAGMTVVSAAGAGYLLFDVWNMEVYEDRSSYEAIRHYISVKSLVFLGSLFLKKLENATSDVAKAQEEFLLKQLRDNKDTEYGRLYNFAAIKSAEEFVRAHPLTRYAHYKPYVQRMMAGEQFVLTKDKPVIFGVTSGTSGTESIIPMLQKQRGIFFLNGVSVAFKCMAQSYPETLCLNKIVKFFYNPTWRMSDAGIKIGPNSSSPSESKSLLHVYSTPSPAFDILNEPEALYLHLLFALRDRHIGMIEANFASLIFNAFKRLEEEIANLGKDIETGKLNSELNIKQETREQLEELLKPDPDRANEIRRAFEVGLVGVAKRLWPDLHILVCGDSGSFALYGSKLRNTYGQGIPLYSPLYGASEGLLGVNIWPDELPSRYLLHPRAQFFELIPISHSDEDQPQTLLLHEAEKGEFYELVITNPSCQYRYRIGDVVKVVGYHNQCPVIEFMYRQGQFLNVRGEKISESLFYEALMDTVAEWSGVKLMDYCCAESITVEDAGITDFKSHLPCYHVFMELEESGAGHVSASQRKQNIDVDEDNVGELQATSNLDINLNINIIGQEKSSKPKLEDIETDQDQCSSPRSEESNPSNEQQLPVFEQNSLSNTVSERNEENIEVDSHVGNTNEAFSTPPVDENSSVSDKTSLADAVLERREEIEYIEVDANTEDSDIAKNGSNPAVDENPSVSENSNLTDARSERTQEIENIEVDENSDHTDITKNGSNPAVDENTSVSENSNLTDARLERKEEAEEIKVDQSVSDLSEVGNDCEPSSDKTVKDIAPTNKGKVSDGSHVVLLVEGDQKESDENTQKEDTVNGVSAPAEEAVTEGKEPICAAADVEKAEVVVPPQEKTVSQFASAEESLEKADNYSPGKLIAAGDNCTRPKSESEGSVRVEVTEQGETSDMGSCIPKNKKESSCRERSPEYREAINTASSDDEQERPWRNFHNKPKKGKESRLPQTRHWSDRDTKMYRERYPNKKDNPNLNLNWRFYSGEVASSPHGTLIDEIHENWWGDYDHLEQHHGYIQWLFPIRESGMNWEAQELQLHEAEKIKKDKQASARFLKSYKMMLDFYGMNLADQKTGRITRATNWKERFCHLNSSMHNYLRITRILKCLGEMGLEHFKKPFLEFVLREAIYEQTLERTLDSCINYWIGTLRLDKERDEIDQYISELNGKKHSRNRRLEGDPDADF